MSADKIAQYVNDPLAFLEDLIIPGARGTVRFGDAMADFQREWFAAIAPALLAVARGERPPIGRYWVERTKGGSKDSDCAACLLWLLAFSSRPLDCQIGAADQDQADELRKAARDILHLNRWLAARVKIQNWRIVCDKSGAAAEIIAADVTGSHGARPDVLILNELSHIAKQEYAENLMDNAAKVPQGLVVIATNAGYLDTFQWNWRELARTSDRWHFHQWAQPAPWLDPDEIDEARLRNSVTRFMRLFYGVWGSKSGDALDPEDIEAAVTLGGPMLGDVPEGWSFVAGLDLGVSNDHSAFVVLGSKHGSNRIALVDCKSWTPPRGGEIDLAAVERYIIATHARLRFRLRYDPWQSKLMAQNLFRRGIYCEPMNFVGQNLNLMASAILEVFATRVIDLYRDDDLIRDLGRLTIVEKSYGYKLESTRDATGHADRATALAICLPDAVTMAHQRAYRDRNPPECISQSIEPARFGVHLENRHHLFN
jgi:hypothetical protein